VSLWRRHLYNKSPPEPGRFKILIMEQDLRAGKNQNTTDVAFIGNTCNYAYNFARMSRQLGVGNSTAFIEQDGIPRDMPEWEDTTYSPLQPPEWVRMYPTSRTGGRLHRNFGRHLLAELSNHAVVHAFGAMAAMWPARLSKPYIYHSYGDIQSTPFRDIQRPLRSALRSLLARNAIQRATVVVLSQLLDIEFAKRLSVYQRVRWIPLPHDVEQIDPRNIEPPSPIRSLVQDHDAVFYIPSRQEEFKRQDKVIEAFNIIKKRTGKRLLLILAEWGTAISERRRQIKDLGLNDSTYWVPCLPRREMLQMLSLPNCAIMDEFEDPPLEMSAGGVSRDAMSMEKVLISRVSIERLYLLHETPPPMLITDHGVRSICEAMEKFIEMTDSERENLGKAARKWMLQEHGATQLFPKYNQLHAEFIG
jgi:glycosyltransferase involved in cell wall biosynthesis